MTAASRTESSALVDWLRAVTGRRDLTLPAPGRDSRSAALERLLACISAEFADYRAVVAGARATVARNADQLGGIAESTRRQGTIVRETAAAVSLASQGAANVADSAVELGRFAIAARTAGTRADGGLVEMAAALEAVVASLRETAGPLDRMAACTHTIGMFLTALGRLSRQAQLLAVNASIEAAHLADAGARFGIVASEVRKLSVSTRDSSADVAGIVGELRDATKRVASAVAESERATAGADRDIAGARSALGATQRAHVDVEGTIEAMSEVAQGQRGALDGVTQAVDGIVRHADEAAAASHTAATLDLTALLDGAERSAMSWTIREAAASNARAGAPDDAVCAWIDGMTGGAASHVLLDDPDPEAQRIAGAVRALLDAVNADQRRVLADVIRVAVAIAHNGYAWRTIGDSLQGLRAEIATVRASVAVSAQGASDASALAAKMRALVHDSQRQHDAALAALEGALARIAAIARAVGDIDALVDAMTAAAARADEIMALIDTLSSETDLLSLNAAIEAAHAGELGRAFGVIADEIRSLALSTHESTQTIAGLVADVGSLSGSLRRTVAQTGDRTHSVTAGAEAVRGAIGELRDAFAVTTARALDVSSIADEQTRALDLVLTNVKRSADAVDADSAAATDKRRLELATLGSRAHAVAARRSIGLTAERIRAFADELAAGVESIIEGAIAGGRLREEAVFDLRYREIDGAHAGELARLFDVSRVPAAGFSPKKFATVWDPVIDEPMCELLDAAFAAGAWFKPVTMLALDLNAFMYAYPRSLIAPWRGDGSDLAGNRIKRLNEDEYTLRITRWGLGPAVDALATRVPYEQFEAAGCTLARGSGERPWGIYPYLRDTNAVYNGLAIGYYVRGRRHGAVRIIYDPDIL